MYFCNELKNYNDLVLMLSFKNEIYMEGGG